MKGGKMEGKRMEEGKKGRHCTTLVEDVLV
jgi:hypothetical protein